MTTALCHFKEHQYSYHFYNTYYRFLTIYLSPNANNHLYSPQRPFYRLEILTEAEEGEDPLHHSCCLQSSVQRHLQGGKINLHVSHKWTETDKWATAATIQERRKAEPGPKSSSHLSLISHTQQEVWLVNPSFHLTLKLAVKALFKYYAKLSEATITARKSNTGRHYVMLRSTLPQV